MQEILNVNNIAVFYGSIRAIKGISFTVNAGEVVTLIGANGAGKTTTLNTIAGLLHPKSGSVSFMGENLAWDIADTLNGMMMIPNLIGVIALSPIVYRITKNYVSRKFKNQDIEPMLSNFDSIQEEFAAAVKGGAE